MIKENTCEKMNRRYFIKESLQVGVAPALPLSFSRFSMESGKKVRIGIVQGTIHLIGRKTDLISPIPEEIGVPNAAQIFLS